MKSSMMVYSDEKNAIETHRQTERERETNSLVLPSLSLAGF